MVRLVFKEGLSQALFGWKTCSACSREMRCQGVCITREERQVKEGHSMIGSLLL
jgi:hypothetical protein